MQIRIIKLERCFDILKKRVILQISANTPLTPGHDCRVFLAQCLMLKKRQVAVRDKKRINRNSKKYTIWKT